MNKKHFIMLIIGVLMGSFALGQTINYEWRFAEDKNPYDCKGETSEFFAHCESGGIESNGLGGMKSCGTPIDNRTVLGRGTGDFVSSVEGTNLTDGGTIPVGDHILLWSTWVGNKAGSCEQNGFSYSHGNVVWTTNFKLHIAYTSVRYNGEGTLGVNAGILNESDQAMKHPLQAGSQIISDPHPITGQTNWVRLVFPSSIMPDPTPSAALANTKFGVRIYRSTLSPAMSVPTDFILVNWGEGATTLRWDGATPDADMWGTLGNGYFYFNDAFVDAALSPNTHYFALPVLLPIGGNCPDGVPMYFEGSWLALGEKSPVVSSLPNCTVLVSSFNADNRFGFFGIRLYWQTLIEDNLAGFNIYREVRNGDNIISPKTQVNWMLIPARGQNGEGTRYMFSDRNRQCAVWGIKRTSEIIYTLEAQGTDGTKMEISSASASIFRNLK